MYVNIDVKTKLFDTIKYKKKIKINLKKINLKNVA